MIDKMPEAIAGRRCAELLKGAWQVYSFRDESGPDCQLPAIPRASYRYWCSHRKLLDDFSEAVVVVYVR